MLSFQIIEDDIEAARRYEQYIRRHDDHFRVTALSGTADAAREDYRSERPDVVVCDVQVPGALGLDLIGEFRAAGWTGIAVVISGHDRFDYACRALRLGATEYLLKPVFRDDFAALLDTIKRNVRYDYIGPGDGTDGLEKPDFIVRAIACIERSYAQDISLRRIADEACVSETYLSSSFRKFCGTTVTEFLIRHRICEAKKLLVATDMPIKAIGAVVGMRDASYFHRCFRRVAGTTPAAFRAESAR